VLHAGHDRDRDAQVKSRQQRRELVRDHLLIGIADKYRSRPANVFQIVRVALPGVRSLLKNCEPQLNEAEALVRIFNDTIEQGHAEDSRVLQQRLRERLKRPGLPFRNFGAAEIAGVYAAYRDMLASWQELPVGGKLELRW
jgi:hypothetical protein